MGKRPYGEAVYKREQDPNDQVLELQGLSILEMSVPCL